jgi:hypothetical protein
VQARVGELPVGTRFITLLTRREGVIRAHGLSFNDGISPVACGDTTVAFLDALPEKRIKHLHPAVLVEVVEQSRETVN